MVQDRERLSLCRAEQAADLVEVFSSIQGEGPRVGERHLFVRTAHCDMHCAYCDTPLCHVSPSEARIELHAGRRDEVRWPNPVPLTRLLDHVVRMLREVPHRAVSFTGGEPLLQPWVIEALAPGIRAEGVATLLETDGNLPDALAGVLDAIDIVSMDWKLPSATQEPARYAEHEQFAQLSRSREFYVKAVFVEDTPDEELLEAATRLARIDPAILLILQPCTPLGPFKRPVPSGRVAELFDRVSRILPCTRVLPQVHRMLHVP